MGDSAQGLISRFTSWGHRTKTILLDIGISSILFCAFYSMLCPNLYCGKLCFHSPIILSQRLISPRSHFPRYRLPGTIDIITALRMYNTRIQTSHFSANLASIFAFSCSLSSFSSSFEASYLAETWLKGFSSLFSNSLRIFSLF